MSEGTTSTFSSSSSRSLIVDVITTNHEPSGAAGAAAEGKRFFAWIKSSPRRARVACPSRSRERTCTERVRAHTARARTTRANVDGPVRARGPVSSRVPGTPSSVSRGRPPRRRRSVAATKDAVGSSGEEFSSDMPPRKRRSVVLSAVNESTKFVAARRRWPRLPRDPSAETLGAVGIDREQRQREDFETDVEPCATDRGGEGGPGDAELARDAACRILSARAAALAHFRDVIPAIGYGGQLVVSAGLVALGVFLSYLRVSTGYHTPPQVIVGHGGIDDGARGSLSD